MKYGFIDQQAKLGLLIPLYHLTGNIFMPFNELEANYHNTYDD